MDMTGMGQKTHASEGVRMAINAMSESIALESLNEVQEQAEARRMKRSFEREQTALEIQKLRTQKSAASSGFVGGEDPTVKFLENLISNPEQFEKWLNMKPEDRQILLYQVQQMQALKNPMMGAGFNAMMPNYMTYGLQRDKGQEISVGDLGKMFTSGIETAMKAVGGQEKTNPMEMVNSVMTLMTPLINRANQADKEAFNARIDALSNKTGVMDTITLIKNINDVFGSGHDTNVDIELAKIRSDSDRNMMAMTMEMKRWEQEEKSEEARWEQIGGIVTTVASAAAPMIGNKMLELGRSVAQGAQHQQMPQQPQGTPTQPQDPAQQMMIVMGACAHCGGKVQINIPRSGPYPKAFNCPHCGKVSEIDWESGGDEGEGPESGGQQQSPRKPGDFL